MRKIQSIILKATIVLFATLFAATVPAFALEGSGTTTDGSTTGTETHKTRSELRNKVAVVAVEGEATTTEDGTQPELHKKGQAKVAELRKHHKSNKTDAQKQKICQSRKQGLENKFKHIVTNSEKIQARIDGVLAKGIAYNTSKSINPDNFDGLVETANTAKATSLASIATLKTLSPSLECNNVSVASDVATFKEAAKTTRDDLKDYRKAVKAVMKSLHTEKKNTTTEGSN